MYQIFYVYSNSTKVLERTFTTTSSYDEIKKQIADKTDDKTDCSGRVKNGIKIFL